MSLPNSRTMAELILALAPNPQLHLDEDRDDLRELAEALSRTGRLLVRVNLNALAEVPVV